MNKDTILKLADKYQEKADKAYMNYQDTGMQRYDRERRNAEDMAEALRAAANAAEEHSALASLRAEFVYDASMADRAIRSGNPKEMEAVLKQIVNYAAAICGYKRME